MAANAVCNIVTIMIIKGLCFPVEYLIYVIFLLYVLSCVLSAFIKRILLLYCKLLIVWFDVRFSRANKMMMTIMMMMMN